MKLWKKWAALITAVLMVFMIAACTPANDETSTPTEQSEPPATEATEAPTTDTTEPPADPTEATEDLSIYKPYLGTWYADGSSAGYRFIVNEDLTWQYAGADMESIFGGGYAMGEETLDLYDADGALAVVLTLEESNKVYAEIYTDAMLDMLSTSYFYNEVLNNDVDFVPVGDDISETIVEPTEDIIIEETIIDDSADAPTA